MDLWIPTNPRLRRFPRATQLSAGALMRQHGVGTIDRRDRDFRRFPGIRVADPLA